MKMEAKTMLYITNKWTVDKYSENDAAITARKKITNISDPDVYDLTEQLEPDLLMHFDGKTYDVLEYGTIQPLGGNLIEPTYFFVIGVDKTMQPNSQVS